jgi:pyruvate formate lyase activating enzyme
MVFVEVDGMPVDVPAGTPVKEVLEALGVHFVAFPSERGIFMPCQTGGCWSCSLDIDGELRPICISDAQEGMRIKTDAAGLTPKRLVGGFIAHRVGGVGTPWWLDGKCVEVACFTGGCNFCCPQCQNWRFAYMGAGEPLTPEEAARQMTATRKRYGVERIAISGGECTLNRRWLIRYLKLLKDYNPGARLHLDTNGSILTGDYLDDLVEAGMTDIGIDLKALRAATFQEITGLVDEALAYRYMETAWQAVEYLHDHHPQVFMGIGIPYNKDLIGLDEIGEMGRRIAEIDPWLQVCALDYRPEFKRQDIARPTYWEMLQIYAILRESGLESVICQTERGKIGPMGRLIS